MGKGSAKHRTKIGKTRRKQAIREPNGRISRAKANRNFTAPSATAEDVRAVALAQPHREAVARVKQGEKNWKQDKRRRDQKAGSAIGLLYLSGMLHPTMAEKGENDRADARYEAALIYQQVMAEVGQIFGPPPLRDSILGKISASDEDAVLLAGGLVENHRDEEPHDRRRRVGAALAGVAHALSRVATSRGIADDLDACVLHDKAPSSLQGLLLCLDALVTHWRIGAGQTKPEPSRPRSRAFDKIAGGLNEALAVARGESKPPRLREAG